LPVPLPPFHFVSDSKIRIGENPKGGTVDFGLIRQIQAPHEIYPVGS
jgi:hypothetical protein